MAICDWFSRETFALSLVSPDSRRMCSVVENPSFLITSDELLLDIKFIINVHHIFS